MNCPSDTALLPVITVRAEQGPIDIPTLLDALRFVESRPRAAASNRDGLIFRLQEAHTPDEIDEAGKAFIAWTQANGLFVGAHDPGAPGGSSARAP
ncbi:hypothetical protein [Chelatococcus reniformis]|uniref:Uncharacterized protein n=1 Tax=Chelatococcus reniformis TaxID=1494448 RepID=A0A916XPZ7_9HYPH|nr:hypothetical protein [Chelatococcus reniformis]GGC94503.1 hypothetical protein GCM10010994_60340 [Chelatococcus reniformis]